MTCRVCTELENLLASALTVDPPERLRGLTEIGERNREHQYRERVEKAKSVLLKHQAQCQHRASLSTPTSIEQDLTALS